MAVTGSTQSNPACRHLNRLLLLLAHFMSAIFVAYCDKGN